jgi:hypothetical protein
MDDLISRGIARSRREIVVDALAHYQNLTMFDWSEGHIMVRQLRRALLTQKSLEQFALKMNDDDLHEAGKRMGQTLHDSLLASSGKDPRKTENHPIAMEILSEIGWGKFTLSDDRIVVNSPFLNKHVLRGYLEYGLGVKLRLAHTIEDVAIFEIERREGA